MPNYKFDYMYYIINIWKLGFNDLLDFLIVFYPSGFNDYSLLYQYVPEDFGYIKNEAYTGNDLLETWLKLKAFRHFDLDLSSNSVSNIYIRSRYFSKTNPFFPECNATELYGNILCNPPYPIDYMKNLFDNIRRNVDKIDNMIIILPTDVGIESREQVYFFKSQYPHKYAEIKMDGNFKEYTRVRRYAVRYHMTLVYIGRNPVEFETQFGKFAKLPTVNQKRKAIEQ
jgi:23S rRNA A1618 N6-methylase RlmF